MTAATTWIVSGSHPHSNETPPWCDEFAASAKNGVATSNVAGRDVIVDSPQLNAADIDEYPLELLATADIATLLIVRAGTCWAHLLRIRVHMLKSAGSSHRFKLSKNSFADRSLVVVVRPGPSEPPLGLLRRLL